MSESEHLTVRVDEIDFIVNVGRDGVWRIVRYNEHGEWHQGTHPEIDNERVIEAAKQRKKQKEAWLRAKRNSTEGPEYLSLMPPVEED